MPNLAHTARSYYTPHQEMHNDVLLAEQALFNVCLNLRGFIFLCVVQVDPSIARPYARLSLEIKQQFDSWEIITEASPFAIAEMFGNIGGFWGEQDQRSTFSSPRIDR